MPEGLQTATGDRAGGRVPHCSLSSLAASPPPSARSSGDRAFASGAKGRRFKSCRAHGTLWRVWSRPQRTLPLQLSVQLQGSGQLSPRCPGCRSGERRGLPTVRTRRNSSPGKRRRPANVGDFQTSAPGEIRAPASDAARQTSGTSKRPHPAKIEPRQASQSTGCADPQRGAYSTPDAIVVLPSCSPVRRSEQPALSPRHAQSGRTARVLPGHPASRRAARPLPRLRPCVGIQGGFLRHIPARARDCLRGSGLVSRPGDLPRARSSRSSLRHQPAATGRPALSATTLGEKASATLAFSPSVVQLRADAPPSRCHAVNGHRDIPICVQATIQQAIPPTRAHGSALRFTGISINIVHAMGLASNDGDRDREPHGATPRLRHRARPLSPGCRAAAAVHATIPLQNQALTQRAADHRRALVVHFNF